MYLLYGVHLFNYYIAGISFADIFLFLLMLYVLYKNKKISIKKRHLMLIYFWLVTGVFGILNISESYFSINNFLFAYLKLSFYILCILIIPPYLAKNIDKTNIIIINSFVFISLLGVYQLIAHFLFPSLPYSLTHELISSRTGYDSMISYGGQFRIRSIYSEPAHFAIYLNILYAYLLHSNVKLNKWIHFLFVIVVTLTFSMSGIALMIINYLIFLFRMNLFSVRTIIYSIAFLILSVFILSNDYVWRRVNRIVTLTETSGSVRLLGGFELSQYFPFYGVGIGNLENYYSSLTVPLMYVTSGQLHNIIPVIIGISGWIGLFVFLLYILSYFKLNKGLFIFLIGSFFAWGYFNAPPFWFFLILFEVLKERESRKALNFGEEHISL